MTYVTLALIENHANVAVALGTLLAAFLAVTATRSN